MSDLTVNSVVDTLMAATSKAGMGDALGDACTINTLGALVIDTSKRHNFKSISADTTFTFSGAAVAGTRFRLQIHNTDFNFTKTVTFPSSFSLARQKVVTTASAFPSLNTVNGDTVLEWEYDGTTYNLRGDFIGVIPAAGQYTYVAGQDAGLTATGADNSVFIGYQAGYAYPSAGQAVAVGYHAGYNPGGYAGTFIGYNAGASGGGTSAVGVGYSAMASADTAGTGNVAVGVHAGETTATLSASIVIGYQAANNAGASATNAIIIGDHAGSGALNMTNSIIIGPFMGQNRASTLHIGMAASLGGTLPLIYGEFDNTYIKINGHFEAKDGVKFPSSDPHIAGYWWDNSGVLTKSAG